MERHKSWKIGAWNVLSINVKEEEIVEDMIRHQIENLGIT